MSAQAQLSFLEQPDGRGRERFEDIVGYLQDRESSSMTHSELERELEKRGRELMRFLLEEHLQRRAQGQCERPVCGADGIERNQQRHQQRDLETIFGTVCLPRTGYGHDGVDSLHPLDVELNLPDELYSLQLRRRVAEEAVKTSFEETTETITNTTGPGLESARPKSWSYGRLWTLTPFTISAKPCKPAALCRSSASRARAL